MKNKTICSMVLGALILISGCDNTFRRQIPPALLLTLDTEDRPSSEVLVNDSLKNFFKAQDLENSRFFELKPVNDEVKIPGVRYTIEGKTGGQIRKVETGELLRGELGELDYNKPIKLAFTPNESIGNYIIRFYPRSEVGNERDPVTLNLAVFDNLLPEARLSLMANDKYGPYGVVFDASQSYDRDAKFGGKITTYSYKIEYPSGELLERRIYNPVQSDVWNGSGTYKVTLVVSDNDGAPSSPVTVSITL